MQTVIETPAFLASAKDENVSDIERQEIVTYIANNPDAGDIMAGTGGARKLRFASQAKGKAAAIGLLLFMQMQIFLSFCSIYTAKVHRKIFLKPNKMNCGKF